MVSSNELHLDLFEPGMSPLHRAGLAGLWMTLEAADGDPNSAATELRKRGRWDRDERSVLLRGTGNGDDFFKALFDYAYPIRQDGLITFAAHGDPLAGIADTLTVHELMLATFLQHPKSRDAEPGPPAGTVGFEIDGKVVAGSYRRVRDHQFRRAQFSPREPNSIAGWLLPGGTERHAGLGGATRISESPTLALALRFGPVGCFFFHVRHVAEGAANIRAAVVVPEIDHLRAYAALRRLLHSRATHQDLRTAGPGDAALRLLVHQEVATIGSLTRCRGCQSTAFGRVPWSSQQQTRVGVVSVTEEWQQLATIHNIIRHHLSPRWVTRENGDPFWRVPQVPEFVAQNLIEGQPWWRGFAELMADAPTRRHVLRWEKEGLQAMVREDDVMPDNADRSFVLVCHEAWRRRLGALSQRAQREGTPFHDLAGREFERLRVRFARCKTATDVRAAATDFWARSGPLPQLHEHWPTLLPFLDERRWQAGRDLALLALASYGGQGATEVATAVAQSIGEGPNQST